MNNIWCLAIFFVGAAGWPSDVSLKETKQISQKKFYVNDQQAVLRSCFGVLTKCMVYDS